MSKIDNKLRQKIEAKIYEVFDTVDVSKTNSEHYKQIFSKMNNDEFYKFLCLPFPFRYHYKPFEDSDPKIENVVKALDKIGVPLMEKVNMPYLYINKDGIPVQSQEALVVTLGLKKVKQFLSKKTAISLDLSLRDMKSGLLTGVDKNGKTSDREMESLAVMGLEKTMDEFSRPKADAMKAKNMMYNIINTKGQVSLDEIPIDIDDSLAKNLMNTYLIGAMLNSNLINQDYYLPYTLKNKKKTVVRV